jgi:beta-glucosidase
MQGLEAKSTAALEERVRLLLDSMTLDEKLHQLSGDTSWFPGFFTRVVAYNHAPFPAGANRRRKIPPLLFVDGPRGVVVGRSTAFPVSMARGASWDPELEARIGDAIGVEVRSQGANLFGGVCINLLRHPAWGRAQETYGEDPHHLGEMGAALVRGVQRHAMACVKHYACNSIENARFGVDVRIDERTLREVYLPHFRRCVDEGAAVIMTAYNKVNGSHCGHHEHLLRDILKGEWGFAGFTLSDFVLGVRDGVAGLQGGLDVEMPLRWRYGRRLRRAVRRGLVPMARVDDAVRRVVAAKLRFADVGEHDRYGPASVACSEHRALAREAATRCMVLLRNEPAPGARVLPIDRDAVASVAVIGALADRPNIGDRGSSMVSPPEVVTPVAGLRAALGTTRVVTVDSDEPGPAAAAARKADIAIVVVGYTHRDEGEYVIAWGGDRISLRLSSAHERLIHAVCDANPRTVVVVSTGSAVVTEAWRQRPAAIVVSWYAGMQGGHALADLLTGQVNFSGKLPCTFPRAASHLPPFDRRARTVDYAGLHGYRMLQARGIRPAFPFGFGLGYTSYEYGTLDLDRSEAQADDVIGAAIEVANVGEHHGEEVVQLYVGTEGSSVPRAPLELRAFQRVALEPGQRRIVRFSLPVRHLAYYDVDERQWVVEPIVYHVHVGPSSDPATHRRATVRVRAHD